MLLKCSSAQCYEQQLCLPLSAAVYTSNFSIEAVFSLKKEKH